jgi:hypothetical protein
VLTRISENVYRNQQKCKIMFNGSNHSLYVNTKNGKKSTVGRITNYQIKCARLVCKQLEIPSI